MADFYLKFNERQEAIDTLSIITTQNDDGETVWRRDMASVAEVGTIYTTTGNTLTDSEGFNYPEKVAVEGWHMNIRTYNTEIISIIENLPDANILTPTTPKVEWLNVKSNHY